MGLLDTVKSENSVTETEVKKGSSHSEYQKKAREKTRAAGKAIKEYFEKNGGVPDSLKEHVDWLAREPQNGGGAFGPTVFEKMFGEKPTVGQVVTAYDMLKKTGKGLADMAKYIKKWAENGIVVEYNEAKFEYTLKSMK